MYVYMYIYMMYKIYDICIYNEKEDINKIYLKLSISFLTVSRYL